MKQVSLQKSSMPGSAAAKFPVILFSLALLFTAEGRETPQPCLRVEVDPRHELISIVHYISGFKIEGWQLKTVLDFDYARNAETWFSPYRNHPAVKRFEEISEGGFTLSAPMAAMLHVSHPPDLVLVHPLPEGTAKRSGGEKSFREFMALLSDFAVTSRFAEFRSNNQAAYMSMVSGYREKLGGRDYVSLLERYMGYPQHSYNVILNPLLGPFNIGSRIVHEDGLSDIYNISGPKSVEQGQLVFGSADGIRNLIWHEFAHSYTNPLVEEHREALEKSSALFEPMKAYMARSGYPEWTGCVDEHIVRAVNIRLCDLEISAEEAQRLLDMDLKNGFVFVPHLLELLKDYEADRVQYPALNHFFPRITALFAGLASHAE